MLEDEEAVDYGEDELNAPVTIKDEASLALEGDSTPVEPLGTGIPVDESSKVEGSIVEADSVTTLEAPLEQAPGSDETVDAHAHVKDEPASPSNEAERESGNDREKSAEPTGAADSSAPAVGRDLERRSDDDKGALAPGWIPIKSRSGDGEVYYYNEKTGESSWSKPTVSSVSRNRASDTKPASTTNADQLRSKKKKKGKRARDAEKAKKAAAAGREPQQQRQQSSQRGRDGHDRRDADRNAAKQNQQEAGKKQQDATKPKDTSTQAEQGFSIKGAAQRQTEPSDSKPTNGAARSNESQQRKAESNGKRKRGNAGGAPDNGSGGGRAKLQAGASAMAKNGSDAKSSGATSDAKRQRTDHDDRVNRDAAPARAVSNWSDDAPRDRRTGDSWRPGGDSARSAATSKYADDKRWSDRRDAASSRDRQRHSERDTTSASASDRRRGADARESDRNRRDDRRDNGREREREQRSAPRSDAANRSSAQPNTAGADSRTSDRGNAARPSSDGKGNNHGRSANGNRNDRNAKDGPASHQQQQRQRGSKGQPHELSSINSTNSQNKRQWGGAGAAATSSKPAPSA